MSDQNTQSTDAGSSEDANLERLRAKAAEADALRERVATMEKRDAFREAGIDPSSGPGQLLFDNIKVDGEMTADAVRAQAEQYGIAPSQSTEPAANAAPAAPAPQQDLSFFEDSSAAAGGSSTDVPESDGYQKAQESWKTVTSRGGSNEEAAHAAIAEVMTAAANGDPAVIYNQEEWRAKHARS